jgi:hypothetical protein
MNPAGPEQDLLIRQIFPKGCVFVDTKGEPEMAHLLCFRPSGRKKDLTNIGALPIVTAVWNTLIFPTFNPFVQYIQLQ